MSRRYSSSTNASRVAEGISARPGFAAVQAPIVEGGADGQSQRTFFTALSVRSGKLGRRLSSRLSEPSTFYREATPPGSAHGEPDEAEARAALATYDGRYDHVAPPAPLPVATRCGVPRRKCCILLWAVAVAVIIAVAVPVGVVFGLRSGRHNSARDTPGDATSSSAPNADVMCVTSTTSSRPPATSTTGTMANAGAASTSAIPCPAANHTLYQVPNSAKRFKRLCGIDYSGRDQARDLASVWTNTMQDCIFQCVNFSGCTGCGWGIIAGDLGSEHRCWLKSDLKALYSLRSGWEFALLEE
ncbi:hypothetical protein A9K55_004604 [Cordyceps militaris]|uniref:Apple domain-containing protein n=1 Tax=Cordyceps militaris TaxID=73501 RepID=A0A2H4SN64_CORMI|nr:hypothetical protein A9K55_004604 [Cordyceps militaris]